MQTAPEKLSWSDIPAEVKDLLMQAVEQWEDTAKSEQYIYQALEKAGENYEVLIGAYRYFFYKNQQKMALKIAQMVLDKIKTEEQLPESWEDQKPRLIQDKEQPKIRLYLNAYAAMGYILARLGEVEQAKQITEQIKEIDTKRESSATTVFEVLTRVPEEDEE
jgi:tetratricopeptide (TPR) repeat protein